MPNYITNVLELDCSDKRFLDVANFVKGDGELGEFDFNTLVKMPEELDVECGSRGSDAHRKYISFLNNLKEGMTAEEVEELEKSYKAQLREEKDWELGKQYYENQRKYGSTTWYDWCVRNWGTKWNACDSDYDPLCHTFTFQTALEGVPNLVKLLSEKFPDVTIDYSFADEDIGYNVGVIRFQNGDDTSSEFPEGGSKRAYELAAEIMGVDLKERGYELTKDGTSYMYVME
ncbi:MAG: hypothetical protein II897_04215 [Clostridia bacterium]|nr:hypothetical protein [Clostridia bacterium]